MEKHKKHKKHRGGNGVGERNRTGKSSERSGHGAITASSAGSSSRYASGDKASNSFKKYAASIDETAAFLPSQNFDAALRAELAEAKALNLGSEAVRHATDMLALHGEVALSDGLVGRCEDALQRQHDLLAATRAQLVEADHINGELREEKLRAEQKAAELTLVLKTQLARQQALQAELDKTIGEMAEQGEVFRQAAAKIAAHREAEAKAFGERRRVWERTIDEWLKAGFQKRIDPLLHNVNQPVYTRLGELLVEEQAQREHQMEYLKLAQAHEVETLRGRFAERLAESDAQYAQLREHQHDFDSSLAAALTEYLRGELAAKTSKVASLEREIRLLHGELRDTRERHDQRDAERQIVSATALDPLRQTMSQLEKGVRSMAQEREQLAGADPRVLLDRQQKLLDEAQADAAKDKRERERLEVELRTERAAHAAAKAELDKRRGEIAAKSMEFGEKEYYQVTLGHLEELQQAKAAEMNELIAMHDAAVAERETELTGLRDERAELRRQRQTMALSLAQYATLETEWGEAKEKAATELLRLQKENKLYKRKASKVAGLEAKLADSSHEEVLKLRTETSQLHARIRLSEESLAASSSHAAKLQEQLDDIQQQRSTEEWVATEQLAEREGELTLQAQRLKDGLAQRVMRQWMLRIVLVTWKSWHMYTVRRSVRRELGDPTLSGDEDKPGAASFVRQKSVTPAPSASLADLAKTHVDKLSADFANFF